jgi:type IV secretory pathway VirD2 relaxase
VGASPGLEAHHPNARRVVVKAHVQRLGTGGAKAAALHLRYIERDGVEKDGSKGVLYGPDGPVRAKKFEEPRFDERHQFRIMVSPEDGGELDLTVYIRRLMARVEADVGRKLEWAAVNHYNTANPHAHVVIRGVALDGEELRLERSYISKGIRWRAQELATEELGVRHEFEIKRAHSREVTQERFTSLDREIERHSKDHRIEVKALAKRSGSIEQGTLVSRLQHLEVMGLAERLSPSAWSLAEGWQQQLRELGTRGDILHQIHSAVRGNPARYHVVGRGKELPQDPWARPGEVLVGRVASKGLTDELKGTFYAVLETPTGAAYHVPLDAHAADALSPGDLVRFGTKQAPPGRPVDRHIVDVAGAHGGIYTPDTMAADEAAARVAHRLRDLERLGLVTEQAPGQWRVPSDLVARLEHRHHAESARHWLLVDKQPLALDAQVRHLGPVWLDKVDSVSLAPYGFGADVARALEQRREALRELGIEPNDRQRSSKLRELEHGAVGDRIAVRTGQKFLAKAPDAFRGRLQQGLEGSPYLVVTDGARFVLVPDSGEARAFVGKTVAISRDANGQLRLRAPDRGRER